MPLPGTHQRDGKALERALLIAGMPSHIVPRARAQKKKKGRRRCKYFDQSVSRTARLLSARRATVSNVLLIGARVSCAGIHKCVDERERERGAGGKKFSGSNGGN